jgi:4-amino-4-deoxy-L-arabinose transferase-like glycosyltransferase
VLARTKIGYGLSFSRFCINRAARAIMSAPRGETVPYRLIILFALLLWSGEYARRDLWEPDEARFALVAREMREDGRWRVPHRQGEPYAHKPPLMFWLINAAVAAGLPERVAARVPSFIGAALSLVAVARLAERWRGRRAAVSSALAISTSFLFWNKGGFGQIDMLLCGLEMTGLMWMFTADGQSRRRAAAYLCWGLAVLAKGPVGLLIPMAVYAAVSAASGDRASALGLHWVWGPVLALAVPGAWLAAAAWQGAPPGFFRELLFDQNIGRVAGAYDHRQPWYYFLAYFPLDFLPWTLALPIAARALMQSADDRRFLRAMLAWIGVVIFLFSLSVSKRNLYILVAYPAAAMLIGGSLDGWASVGAAWPRATRVALRVLLGLLSTGLVAAMFVPAAALPWWSALPPALAFAAGAARRKTEEPAAWMRATMAAVAVGYALVGALVYPQFNDRKTPDEIAPVAERVLAPSQYIILYKQHGEIVSLYARRPGRMADNEEELRALLAHQPRNLIVTASERLAEVQAVVGTDAPVGYLTYGSKRRVWIEWPAP